MRSRLGTWALAVSVLAVVFASMGMMGSIVYIGIAFQLSSDPSPWNLAWAFPLGGFVGLMMVWVLLWLVSPPD